MFVYANNQRILIKSVCMYPNTLHCFKLGADPLHPTQLRKATESVRRRPRDAAAALGGRDGNDQSEWCLRV